MLSMFYFYQRRVDGVTFDGMVKQNFGDTGFGIECPYLISELKNPRLNLAHNWRSWLAKLRRRPHVLNRL